MESIGKNLWMLITIVVPGLFTYGAWRLLLFLYPSSTLTIETFEVIDNSSLITCCIIIAIALLQQALAIVIEFFLSLISLIRKEQWKNLHSMFWDRFKLASEDCLNESSERIIGNFFLSLNILIGLLFILSYFVWYEHLTLNSWVLKSLIFFIVVNSITAIYRLINAVSVIAICKKTKKPNLIY